MKTKIVIGLGYGDEGKGITTDYLCQQSEQPLVIRFSGGHQAGHTVVTEDGTRHVFSSFGAGSLRGVPSYWSRFCTFYPIGFINEWKALESKNIIPTIFVDALTPVTTPYDVFHNQSTEKINGHGSCGVGFGATVARDELTPYKLYVQDLAYPVVLEQKLKVIRHYYEQKTNRSFSHLDEHLDLFKIIVADIVEKITIVHEPIFFKNLKEQEYSDLIFEGSQGILLDMDHGFFPNVTRANTVSKNAKTLIQRYDLTAPELYYITRAYQTRHGNGFLSNEGIPLNVNPNPLETNQYNEWQGHQRQSLLDIDLLNYALDCDKNYSGDWNKNLVITCLDQLDGNLFATQNGKVKEFKDNFELLRTLNFKPRCLLESYSDCSSEMKCGIVNAETLSSLR